MRSLWAGFVFALAVNVAPAQEVRVSDQVFVVQDPKASQIRFQMLVQAGCADEADNQCRGLAHYLEHLVLAGRNAQNTETAAMRFFPDGDSNGWTSARVTGYVHSFPAKSADLAARLDKLFSFYGSRLVPFVISEADGERERLIVRQERDWRLSANPYVDGLIAINAFLYPGRPLPVWPGGTPEDIAAFTVADAGAFHKKWYGLNNVAFIVSGPIAPEAVKPFVDKHLAALQPIPVPPRPWLTDATPLAPETRDFSFSDRRIASPSLILAKAVSFSETDALKTVAVAHLTNAFFGSKIQGSPHSVFVEQNELALSAAASLQRTTATLLTLQVMVDNDDGVPMDRISREARAWRDGFLAEGFDQKTLDRLKNRFRQSYARELAEPSKAPQRLINWLSIPLPYDRLKDLPDAIETVTLADMKAIFAALQAPGREVSVSFLPKQD